jgi:hypothetical protein
MKMGRKKIKSTSIPGTISKLATDCILKEKPKK